MRVLKQSQRGAVMALTAISLVVLLGATAVAVDISLGWQTRRNLVTSTDAAALAAAQTYSKGGNGCANDAAAFLASNAPSATMTLCTTGSATNGEGTVTVSAVETVDVYFGRAIGLNPYPAGSSTTALWGPPSSATGLRPIGLCVSGIQSFFDNPQATQTIEIPYDEQGGGSGQIEGCFPNVTPTQGNWGIVNFEDGPSNAQIKDELLNGYQNPVYTGTTGGNCNTEAYACYEGNEGQGLTNAYKTELAYLKNNNIYFTVPIFDLYVIEPGLKQVHLVAFARVRVIAYKLTGANRSITLEFSPGLIEGACCNPGGPPSNSDVISICAVKENDLSGC